MTAHVPNKCLTPLIHGLIMSKIRYALPVFCEVRTTPGDAVSQPMKDLQVQLNTAVRCVQGVKLKDRFPIPELLQTVGVPSVNQLAIQTTLMEVWRHLNLGLPASCSFVLRDEKSGERVTRKSEKNFLALPQHGGGGAGNFVRNGTKLWNIAPQELRDEKDFKCAKRIIKDFAESMPI